MHFIAFISYKHAEPDRGCAEWLHSKLEKYRVPKGITAPQLGTRRIGRVFRDDEELAASTDLSAAIRGALNKSEHLIVICSPAAASSKYVNQEIREFASLGRQDKVLALLVEGEPEHAFPPALKEFAHEPLAADVRNSTARTRNKAALRLLAAILNCTFDELRRRERLRIKQRIQFSALAIAICVLLVLGTRYGVYRLSLENTSIGTYDLVVKYGLPFMEPLLGSNQSHVEVSDKLYEVSPKGQEHFAGGSSIFFPAFNKHHLFRWLNDYYLGELKQSPNKKAEVSNFFLEQLQIDDQASEAELVKALSDGAPAAYEVVLAHRLTAQHFQTALLKALEDQDPKTKALTLNVLHELYSDDSRSRALTEKAFGACDADTVKIAMALSYPPDSAFLTQCATKLLAEKHWKDAASLVVRFQLPHATVSPWITAALDSSALEEFQAAADIVMGLNLNDPATIASLCKRLSDSNEKVKNGAALALWNLGEDRELVRQRLREMILSDDMQLPLNNYVALFRSSLSDNEVTRGLEKRLTGVGSGDSTGGWLVAGPDAVDVIRNLKTKNTVDVCLSEEKKARPEDYAQAILTARSVMLGCHDQSVLNSLDSYVRTGVPGLLGTMIDPNVSEAYGSMLVEDQHESFDSGLERLWNLLKSQRAESSANYRLAVQFALARLVVCATSDAQIQQRHLEVMNKVRPWADDEAPHHRASFVNVSRLIHAAIDEKRLMPLKTQF
jgi:MTH538 TIR-like domain (DUF1863)